MKLLYFHNIAYFLQYNTRKKGLPLTSFSTTQESLINMFLLQGVVVLLLSREFAKFAGCRANSYVGWCLFWLLVSGCCLFYVLIPFYRHEQAAFKRLLLHYLPFLSSCSSYTYFVGFPRLYSLCSPSL
jgi:hypothetical protein